MRLTETFNYYYHEMADPRVTNWPLMGSIWPLFLIVVSYVYFVFQLGPRFMKNRPAYELKTFIRLYNIFQVIANAYLVYEILAVYPDASAFRCITSDYSRNPDAIRVARACYYMILLKVVNLIETGLFVLRKKKNQISFLHVYHHITTLSFGLILARYFSAGPAVFLPVINGSVHVIMYSYYFLSSIDEVKEAVYPMKRYVTIIQMSAGSNQFQNRGFAGLGIAGIITALHYEVMFERLIVQFVFMVLHTLVGLSPSCHFPKWAPILVFLNTVFNFYLFYNFYRRAYMDPKKTK